MPKWHSWLKVGSPLAETANALCSYFGLSFLSCLISFFFGGVEELFCECHMSAH